MTLLLSMGSVQSSVVSYTTHLAKNLAKYKLHFDNREYPLGAYTIDESLRFYNVMRGKKAQAAHLVLVYRCHGGWCNNCSMYRTSSQSSHLIDGGIRAVTTAAL